MQLARSKYGNRRTEYAGVAYASTAEARRAQDLDLMLRAGCIYNLKRQVRYQLVVNGIKVAQYVSDFEYEDLNKGIHVVEDVKGCITREYIIKRRLMKALHGIDIQEVTA
jgi:hypothetical protein